MGMERLKIQNDFAKKHYSEMMDAQKLIISDFDSISDAQRIVLLENAVYDLRNTVNMIADFIANLHESYPKNENEISEGIERKGGVNSRPLTPPPSPPHGQSETKGATR